MARGRPSKKQKFSHNTTPRDNTTAQGNWIDSIESQTSQDPSYPPLDAALEGVLFDENGGYNHGTTIFESLDDTLPRSSTKRRVYAASNDPLLPWLQHRNEYLDEMMRAEGCSNQTLTCQDPECPSDGHQPDVLIRCNECFQCPFMCRLCCLRRHKLHPFHRIQRWTGDFFEPISLKELGLVICLGHSGKECVLPSNHHTRITVLHTNGLHDVHIKFCSCPAPTLPIERRVQLLRARLFPATSTLPRTCASFDLLRHSHILMLQSNVSAYHVYHTIERLTDNAGIAPIKSRYKSFLTLMRKWRYIKLMKRSGRSFDPAGVEGCRPGELAVLCPACPWPDINLPDNWDAKGIDKPYLYELFLGADGNFRLKNRNRTADTPGLVTGLAYFVADVPYQQYLRACPTQTDTSTCSGLTAVDHANTRKSGGLRATGVGAVVCARHGFYLPCGLGDLQKGERYANMDYIIFSAIHHCKASWRSITLSYDIACQYFVNLQRRLDAKHFPPSFRPDNRRTKLTAAIPKFHLPAHEQRCHTLYSLNLQPGAGRLDGEVIERDWAKLGGASSSTKEMSAGSRRDTIDDMCGDMNFTKLKTMGPHFARKQRAACAAASHHALVFEELSATIDSVLRSKWEKMIGVFENDKTKPNPYVVQTKSYLTLQEVRHQLLQQERVSSFTEDSSNVSFVSLVLSGLEIEDAQHELRRTVSDVKSPTAQQLSTIAEGRLSLDRRIRTFRNMQTALMPFALDTEGRSSQPEKEPLRLPSSFPTRRDSLPCSMLTLPQLQDIEAQLRFAQAKEALDDLRRQILVQVYYMKYTRTNVRGQRSNTRSQSLLKQTLRKIQSIAERYRRIRAAHKQLVGDGRWESELRPLADDDIRPLSQDHIVREGRSLGEGHKQVSWIWYGSVSAEDSSEHLNEALRIEWAWARARKLRWEEEVDHVQEEMRRFVESARHFAEWWLSCSSQHVSTSSELADGLKAYATRQAYIRIRQAVIASQMWNLPRRLNFWETGRAADLISRSNAAFISKCANAAEDDVEADCDVEDESFDIEEDEMNDLDMSDVD